MIEHFWSGTRTALDLITAETVAHVDALATIINKELSNIIILIYY